MSRGAYGAAVPGGPGGVVASIEPGGPADRAGIVAGDTIIAVDGRTLDDMLDWQWLTAGSGFVARVRDQRGAERDVSVASAWDDPPGVEFAAALFDGVRECDNACEFCFVSQLPPGLRASLYVRDDDFRLSFLSGNFITLTNLDDADVDRILEQRLSPLYWSVHAVDADVRRSLVCASGADRALEFADRLLDGGIVLHAQVVLVPGRNDGAVLDRTLGWLVARDGVASVGVVPVGVTAFSRVRDTYSDAGAANAVLDRLEQWRERMSRERGEAWAYAADEFYLKAGRELPSSSEYAGFPQYENGVGMTRAFIDAWHDELEEAGARPDRVGALTGSDGTPSRSLTLVTGTLFAPVLRDLAVDGKGAGLDLGVLAVENRFLGGEVSVAGLLSARDLAHAIQADGHRGTYVVPDVILNTDGLTIDGVPESELAALCGADVRVVSSDAADAMSVLREMSVEQGG